MELALGGLTSGIVGCTPEDLSDVSADESLPDMFWIGKEKPSALPVTKSGDWYLSSRAEGGFTVFSKYRKPVFGEQARERRKREIDVEIASLSDKRKKLNEQRVKFTDSQTQLYKSDKEIRYFLENKSFADRIKDSWLSAKARKERTEKQLKEAKAERGQLQDEISLLAKPYQQQIADLKGQKITVEFNLKTLREDIKNLKPQIIEARAAISEATDKLQRVKVVLGADYERLLSEAENLELLSDITYSKKQTRRIDIVSRGLEDEPAVRIAVFQEADSMDEMSCARLWPVLKDILRDRVSAEVLDNLNDDMIKSMRERRLHLDVQLRDQEQEVKIEAKNIYMSLRSEIRSKQQQIKRLSKLGEGLQFGNITGIRINVQIQENMLFPRKRPEVYVLKGFASHREALAEYSETDGSENRRRGSSDYRTYMDLLQFDANRDWGRFVIVGGVDWMYPL
jgi:hypothetical protein